MTRTSFLMTGCFLIAVAAIGAPLLERTVVIPVQTGVFPGQLGVVWTVELTVRNVSDNEVTVVLGAGGPPVAYLIPPGSTVKNPFSPGSRSLIASDLAALKFDLRVRANGQTATTKTTALPVIRGTEFVREPINLLNVNASSDSARSLLRVSTILSDPFKPSRTHIRAFDQETDASVGEIEVSIGGHGFGDGLTAEVPLDFPSNRTLRLEITNIDGDLQWAFVSVTDNSTGDVSLMLPE